MAGAAPNGLMVKCGDTGARSCLTLPGATSLLHSVTWLLSSVRSILATQRGQPHAIVVCCAG